MSETFTPVIAMVQGGMLILLSGSAQSSLRVSSPSYAAELAAAINAVTGDVMDEAMADDCHPKPAALSRAISGE